MAKGRHAESCICYMFGQAANSKKSCGVGDTHTHAPTDGDRDNQLEFIVRQSQNTHMQ